MQKRITLNGKLVDVDEYPSLRMMLNKDLAQLLLEEESNENYECCTHVMEELNHRDIRIVNTTGSKGELVRTFSFGNKWENGEVVNA